MSTSLPDTSPTWFRLTDEAWAELGRAYMAGATAKALSAQYNVRPQTIYRHAKKNGWQKWRNPAASVRARMLGAGHAPHAVRAAPGDPSDLAIAPSPYGPTAPVFAPDPRYWLDRYTASEAFDPGVTAQIAVSASAGAMLAGALGDAVVLAQIGYLHARIAKLNPQSLRAQVFEALTDEDACNHMFSRDRRNGEERLKDDYDHWRRQQRDAETRRGWALERAEARIAALEAQLAAGEGGG